MATISLLLLMLALLRDLLHGLERARDAAVFGVAVQTAGFVIMSMLIPDKLRNSCFEPNLQPAARRLPGCSRRSHSSCAPR